MKIVIIFSVFVCKNYETIKCLTFSESQGQAELNDDDDKHENEELDVD